MKRLGILVLLLSFLETLLWANSSLIKNIDREISQLSQEIVRQKPNQKLHIGYDPFYPNSKKRATKKSHTKRSTKKVLYKPTLSMILNKRAFIDNHWYKENEKISDYVVYKIYQDTVLLKKRAKIVTLRLKEEPTILVTKEGL